MWSVTSKESAASGPIRPLVSLASSDQIMSVGHPFVKIRLSTLPGRGYVITMNAPENREVTTPTIPFEAISRALEGREVIIQNGGFIAKFSPADGLIRVKGGPLAGLCLEGCFRPEDLEAAARTASERNLA